MLRRCFELLRRTVACHVAVGLVLLVGSPVHADDRNAADVLRKHGAEIALDDDGFAVSLRLRESGRLSRDEFTLIGGMTKLRTLGLSGGRTLGDEQLAQLGNLSALERVSLDGFMLTDDGLRHLAGWKSLTKLTFYNITNRGRFNGSGLQHLAELPRFEEFNCGGSSFDDAGLEACSRLTRLTKLWLWHTPITDAGVPHLKKLSGLKSLRLLAQWRPRITDAALPHLAEMKSLEQLDLGETRFTYAGLRHLRELPSLKRLDLYQVELADGDLVRLRADLPNVEVLWSPVAEKYRDLFRQNFERGNK